VSIDCRSLACPRDRGNLVPTSQGACCESCGQLFPLREGILCLLPDQFEQGSGDLAWQCKRQEQQARDAQAGRYDRMLGLRLLTHLERPHVLRAVALQRDQVVLDAGCGTGRLTTALARRCRVVAVDFSLASLVRCRRKLERQGLAATLVQGDITHLPLAAGAVDALASCQVIEHLPGAPDRERALREFHRVLRPGGRLVATAYHYNWATRWFGPREGYHRGGIFYHRFALPEYRALLQDHFELSAVRPLGGYLLLAAGRKPMEETS